MRKHLAIRYIGVLIFLLAIVVRVILGLDDSLFETVYLHGLFPNIRFLQSSFSAFSPLPGYYLLFIIVSFWFFVRFPGILRVRNGSIRSGAAWMLFGRRFLNFTCTVLSAFLLLWGYNYLDIGVSGRLALVESPERNMLGKAYMEAMASAMNARMDVPGIQNLGSIEDVTDYPNSDMISSWVRNELSTLGYPTKHGVTVRYLKPDGLLRRLSISGIYNPFFGDAHVDNALGPLLRTFTAAHEIAHAYGVCSEADANFVAWIACRNSGDPLAEYAAEYVLWRHLAAEVNKVLPVETLENLVAAIPEPLRQDRTAIWSNYHRYKGYFPEISSSLNDTYLKLQGVEAGVDDYDGFVNLWFDYNWTVLNKQY